MGPPPGGGKNPALIIVLIVLVVGAVIGGAILLTSGDDDDEPTAGTTIPGGQGGEGGQGGQGTATVPPITLPDGSEITLPDGSDITLPSIPDGGGIAEDGPPTQPPGGGDATLQGLADDCYNGDMQACDDLFMQSEADSELEDYGDTCGHRFPTSQGFCVNALPDPQPPS
jgi:hypothetical protein